MPRDALTGTRIRERRMLAGMRQADLARVLGVSAAYLNLIEHNRRRVSAQLTEAAAAALGVETSALAEGAEAPLFDGLREAAAGAPAGAAPETDRIEEFVGRFPGWAGLLAARQTRLRALERTVETLTERIAQDPHLSASLHEVLSAVTSVRSTAAILAETEDLDPEWRTRFHRNLGQDSARLAEAATGLVAYLDAGRDADAVLSTPQEEVEAWLARQDYHLAALEDAAGAAADPTAGAPELASAAARTLAAAHAARYRADAALLPLAPFRAAVAAAGADPAALARQFGAPLAAVLRRLATLPPGPDLPPMGLVACDASGTLVFRKPLPGFPLPRFGGACPLWPLYDALARPGAPLRRRVETAGLVPRRFLAYALAEARYPAGFDGAPVVEALMLVLPAPGPATGEERAVGSSCRVCPRAGCPQRREPSITADAPP